MATVRFEQSGNLGLITLDNPPVNALNHALRAGLADALRQAEQTPEVQAVLLLGEGRGFSAGADIKEFGQPPREPGLPEVVNAIEASTKPVVAVLHGNALGGGLEVALGAHYRIATADTQLGVPEVKLGLLPGAGGTQRLPRVVGASTALQMIVSGTPVNGEAALAAGLIDALYQGDRVQAGIAFAQRLLAEGQGVRRSGERTVALESEDAGAFFATQRAEVERKHPGLFSPLRCVAAVEAAVQLPLAEGLKRERELFIECLHSPQRAALVHAFFAEREASKVPGLEGDVRPRPVDTAAVIGGGTMGVGIAMSFANAGLPVKLLEVDQAALARALQRARDTYGASVKRGSLSAADMEQRLALIEGVTDYNALAQVDVVVEAVFEDMAVKRQVFSTLDAICKPGALLASNTSSLDLNEIAASTRRPEDVIGLHFFSPANVMRLLEVVRGEKTSATTLATGMALGKRLKKVCAVVGVCDGFVGNRMLFQYGRESEFLLEEGATPEQVDAALRKFGMAMGPFAMRDLSGLDIGMAIRNRQREQLPAQYTLPCLLDLLFEKNMLGQKTGSGFYRYENGSRTPLPNPELPALLDAASRQQGIERRALSDDYILDRTLLALVNEGAKILAEGIALRASDIDLIYLNGYGFPAFRGGPMFYADQLGLATVLERIERFNRELGAWWEPAPLLQQLAREGGSFGAWEARP
ncbi:3-hydroxyacyl-CoA dehydrogenase NAD-binding domain-containing protein [Pseudomonas sp. RIT-PI-S]|uniref:3-hydroxyacyl-CoA dehydrogenase NAD-binding domain-containing protein n=1 Tax=Pseudomonas sp. RIT-PI-S TaxID=3035295 RepID=UPI0021D96990|nr:3-hydroxyacyl-CoA dehydrogenase NAD-binding domain-containing protein [Pseudomonas sp. RIT-PI-S]